MNQTEWMNDPLVAGIDKTKLQFLQMLVFEGQNLTKEQMLPFLMSVAQKGKKQNISFDDNEIDAIVTALQKYSTPEEINKINKLMALKKKR
ncbi:MAG: hypothetical protein HFI00_02215 [Lachnospiraceae bacterium]|jgi:hypothetical protein|nr:hypothetical protein [Lachnospiraceae bacterium]MCI9107029.1 hypothetical protein [Lachnospiraceae bacterium]